MTVMIQIIKRQEPKAWTLKVATPGFDEYEPIPELREALLIEQGYICAYCMRRIPIKDKGVKEASKIEHILSRENRPDLQLDYTNMVICCPGFINGEDHCDKSKGSRSVTFLPHRPFLQLSISYHSKNGEIKSSNAT